MYPEIPFYSFKIDTYIFIYLMAIIVASVLLRLELKRNSYSASLYFLLASTALIAGIVGSKIYYIVEAWDQFIQNPWQTFFAIAGSTWYGGFILGFS
jgi:prolipoprotein diacylglyceryltransferase